MHTNDSYHLRRQVLWGLLLVGLGVAFLLDQLDIYQVDRLWHYAPLLLVVSGINQTIGYPSTREFLNGLWSVFIGLWLFACLDGSFGLTFWNSWPLFIIVGGLGIAIKPLAQRRFGANPEHGCREKKLGERHGQ